MSSTQITPDGSRIMSIWKKTDQGFELVSENLGQGTTVSTSSVDGDDGRVVPAPTPSPENPETPPVLSRWKRRRGAETAETAAAAAVEDDTWWNWEEVREGEQVDETDFYVIEAASEEVWVEEDGLPRARSGSPDLHVLRQTTVRTPLPPEGTCRIC
jgi:hypothetical protein